MIQVFAISLAGGDSHEHIAEVRWLNPSTGKQGTSTRSAMVTWLRKENRAYVCDGRSIVDIGVVDANPPYIRTYADRRWTNNLLSLPRY